MRLNPARVPVLFGLLAALLVVVLGGGQLAVLDRLKRRIGTYRLVAAGLGVLSLAFVALIPAALATGDKRVSMLWLIVCLTLMVVGELLIAPLGLALVLRLTPSRFVGLVAGLAFLVSVIFVFSFLCDTSTMEPSITLFKSTCSSSLRE